MESPCSATPAVEKFASSKLSHITVDRVLKFSGANISVTGSSLAVSMNTFRKPFIIPGLYKGIETLINVSVELLPRDLEAFIYLSPIKLTHVTIGPYAVDKNSTVYPKINITHV